MTNELFSTLDFILEVLLRGGSFIALISMILGLIYILKKAFDARLLMIDEELENTRRLLSIEFAIWSGVAILGFWVFVNTAYHLVITIFGS